jgi:hypothetical protein
MGLVVGGALTEVSWRLAFLVNVPIGLLVIYLALTMLRETQKERMKLDAAGAVLATLVCAAAVFGFSMGPEKGWLSTITIGSGLVALGAFVALVVVERTAAAAQYTSAQLAGFRPRAQPGVLSSGCVVTTFRSYHSGPH